MESDALRAVHGRQVATVTKAKTRVRTRLRSRLAIEQPRKKQTVNLENGACSTVDKRSEVKVKSKGDVCEVQQEAQR